MNRVLKLNQIWTPENHEFRLEKLHNEIKLQEALNVRLWGV